ncbi:MAG TPA: non-homologous end-joining DNA ligase [Alphaproteobacteria bacterium]|jgi:bifunctional non-homologous end joining protein LigD
MTQASTRARKPAPAAARVPAFTEPELATLVDTPPEGERWIHETKYDGYRCLLAVGGREVVCYSRSGLDWTDKFASLVEPARKLPVSSALIDGEAAVLDQNGVSSFSLLQDALRTGAPVLYFAFDLLAQDGANLRHLPLIERKRRLREILGRGRGRLRFSVHIAGNGGEILRQLCAAGFEGIVSKRKDSAYRSGRGRDWLKTKCGKRQEFVIGGWTASSRRRGFRSLLLGYFERGRLKYAGRVGTGFDADTLAELSARLERLKTRRCPFDDVPRSVARTAHWVRPTLVAEIAFAGFTGDGIVRHGSFIGLRADKLAKAVTKELPRDAARR